MRRPRWHETILCVFALLAVLPATGCSVATHRVGETVKSGPIVLTLNHAEHYSFGTGRPPGHFRARWVLAVDVTVANSSEVTVAPFSGSRSLTLSGADGAPRSLWDFVVTDSQGNHLRAARQLPFVLVGPKSHVAMTLRYSIVSGDEKGAWILRHPGTVGSPAAWTISFAESWSPRL